MVECMAQAQFHPEPGPGTSTSAAPQLTVAPTRDSGGNEGLSLRTLVIAAIASAAAAIVTSAFWKGGTVISAAITPVIVSIVKEIVERPRDVVRRASAFTTATERGAPGAIRPDVRARSDAPVAPIRTYGRPARRRIHLKVALVTGLVAFLIAAVVLTVPELVFGGSVATKGHTTLFGGKARTSSKPSSTSEQKTTPDANQAPAQTPPSTDGQQQQPDAQSQPGTSQPAPQGQPPAQQSPAPAAPGGSAPAPAPTP
jgi:uncharacterized membrane protein YvlD (DUF360 family)